jgi:hypothetical protein
VKRLHQCLAADATDNFVLLDPVARIKSKTIQQQIFKKQKAKNKQKRKEDFLIARVKMSE